MRSIVRSTSTLGSTIRAARRAGGLTQADLGLRTSLRQATISRLEQGGGGTLESLFKILSALNLDLHVDERATAQPGLDEIF